MASLQQVNVLPATHARLQCMLYAGNYFHSTELSHLRGFPELRQISLVDDESPLEELGFVSQQSYEASVLAALPHLSLLDGKSVQNT